AMPCLSSRIPHGEEITVEKLSQVGEAESMVKHLSGARDIKVRHHVQVAAIEVSPEELSLFDQDGLMSRIEAELRLIGFTSLTMGPRKSPLKQDGVVAGQEFLLPMINTTQ